MKYMAVFMHGHGRETNGLAGRGGIEELLETGELPCFLVDPDRSTLEAVNVAARALFDLEANHDLPVGLDSTMPAIKTLRNFMSQGGTKSTETLGFWIGGRMKKLPCSITAIIADQGLQRGRSLIRIQCLAIHGQKAGRGDTIPVDDDPAELGASAPEKRSDAETLREIARRIRQGQPARRPPTASSGRLPDRETTNERPPARPDIEQTATAAPMPNARTLARIAHELKTPLSAIVAASEIMRDERLGEMQNARYLEYARDIHESARHALDVIDAMLKRGAGETSRAEPLALDKIAAATVSAMAPLADNLHIVLAARSEMGQLEILADPTGVRQIIYNLIANALKFTPSGGEVHVLTGYLDDGSVYLVVRDTGQGMDEATIAQAFFADGAPTPRAGGGYGLGLPIVRKLAEDMGASLEVDSAPGKGTVILLSFPRFHSR